MVVSPDRGKSSSVTEQMAKGINVAAESASRFLSVPLISTQRFFSFRPFHAYDARGVA